MRKRKKKSLLENIDSIRKELEKKGFRVKDNPDALHFKTDTLLLLGGIKSLSNNIGDAIMSLSHTVLTIGLAMITAITIIGVVLVL